MKTDIFYIKGCATVRLSPKITISVNSQIIGLMERFNKVTIDEATWLEAERSGDEKMVCMDVYLTGHSKIRLLCEWRWKILVT